MLMTFDCHSEVSVLLCRQQYECLVEGCGVKLKSYKSRQQHLVDKHKFPTSFEFFKKANPSKRHRQKHPKKQSGGFRDDTKDSAMDVDERTSKHRNHKHGPKEVAYKEQEVEDAGMEVEGMVDELASAVSKLSTADSTPSSISFGHRHARGLTFLPRSLRQNAKQVSQSDVKR